MSNTEVATCGLASHLTIRKWRIAQDHPIGRVAMSFCRTPILSFAGRDRKDRSSVYEAEAVAQLPEPLTRRSDSDAIGRGDALRSQCKPRPGWHRSPSQMSAIGVVADRWPCTELTRCLYFTLVVEALSGANPSQTIGPQYPGKL